MIEFADNQPDIGVQEAEYVRLLGYPRGWTLEGRARELADWARQWYAAHGRPWMYVRGVDGVTLDGTAVRIEGDWYSSAHLHATLHEAEAQAVAIAAVSAGPELEAEAQRLWQAERPDEYFFLEAYGSAVVEHLTMLAGARLRARAEPLGLAVLPHASPGYAGWNMADQSRLLALLARGALPGPIAALDSGMLTPKKSLLAVFGLTRHAGRVRQLAELVPCDRCQYAGCQFRRTPYQRPPAPSAHGVQTVQSDDEHTAAEAAPLTLRASYTVSPKALDRWARDRLAIDRRADGRIVASFRYEGSTCTNMGRPLAFDYTVQLGTRDVGYRIERQGCAPADGHDGYVHMCAYMENGESLMRAVDEEKPLLGRRLDDVLVWLWPSAAAGCYCDAASRTHKWGLVLQTIHYALSNEERDPRAANGAGAAAS